MIAQAKAADPDIKWTIDKHSKGRAVIVEDGSIWEKGCISYTLIENGELTAVRAEAISARTNSAIAEGAKYSACALSFVLHARSPMVPTLRGDVRIFAVAGGAEWYGGGCAHTPYSKQTPPRHPSAYPCVQYSLVLPLSRRIDLTPSYVEDDDCTYFHTELSKLCAAHGEPTTYAEMKATCDEYFYIPCRKEHRGVGGVFFDDVSTDWAAGFAEALMQCALAEDGPYMPIVRKRLPLEFTEAQKEWQCIRRGRYIEFNLLYDRGVKFGLSPESVERVLVSSPPQVAFKYKGHEFPPGTPEADTIEVLRSPREWVA